MNNDAPITNSQLAATLRGWADTLSPTPPPVAEDKDDEHAQSPAPTTGTANTRPYAAVVADGKVAPAFDAARFASRFSVDSSGSAPYAMIKAVEAAHAAGAASAKPRRWPDQKPTDGTPYVHIWQHGRWLSGGLWSLQPGDLWMYPPAPPADAKEASQ